MTGLGEVTVEEKPRSLEERIMNVVKEDFYLISPWIIVLWPFNFEPEKPIVLPIYVKHKSQIHRGEIIFKVGRYDKNKTQQNTIYIVPDTRESPISMISRNPHFEIKVSITGGRLLVYLRDKSKFGTYLNGKKLTKEEKILNKSAEIHFFIPSYYLPPNPHEYTLGFKYSLIRKENLPSKDVEFATPSNPVYLTLRKSPDWYEKFLAFYLKEKNAIKLSLYGS